MPVPRSTGKPTRRERHQEYIIEQIQHRVTTLHAARRRGVVGMALGAALGSVLGATMGFVIGESPDRFRIGMEDFFERVGPMMQKIVAETRREAAQPAAPPSPPTPTPPPQPPPHYEWIAVEKDKREHIFDTTQFPADSLCRKIHLGPPDGTTILTSADACKGTCSVCSKVAAGVGIVSEHGPMAAKPKSTKKKKPKRHMHSRRRAQQAPPPPLESAPAPLTGDEE